MKIEAVVFDIGNVLIEWNPERFYEARLGLDRASRFFAETDIHAVNLEIDRGADFESSIRQHAEVHSNWREEIMLWHDHWLDLASPAIDHSVRLLRALQNKDFPVFALSNFGVGTFEIACEAYPYLTSFDQSYISGHLRQIKPDPGIYEALERGSGLAPETLFFTDDRPENIAAAHARGWHTHLFDGAAGLAQALVEAGILREDEAR